VILSKKYIGSGAVEDSVDKGKSGEHRTSCIECTLEGQSRLAALRVWYQKMFIAEYFVSRLFIEARVRGEIP